VTIETSLEPKDQDGVARLIVLLRRAVANYKARGVERHDRVVQQTRPRLIRSLAAFFNRLWPLLFGYDFFLSYRRADAAAFAQSLAEALQARGFVCFLDREETVGGTVLTPAIERALKRSRALVAILTAGVLDSDWVKREIERFLRKGNRLIPINVDEFLARPDVDGTPFAALRDVSFINADNGTIAAGVVPTTVPEEIRKNYDRRRVRTLAVWLGTSLVAAFAIGAAYVGNGYLEDRRQRDIAYSDASAVVADTRTLLRFMLFAAQNFSSRAGDPTSQPTIHSYAVQEVVTVLERFNLAAITVNHGPFIGFKPISPPGDTRQPVAVLSSGARQLRDRFDAIGRRKLALAGGSMIDGVRGVAGHRFLRDLADAEDAMSRYHRIEDSVKLRFVLIGSPGVTSREAYLDFIQALGRLERELRF
jgi:hypothetical protein